MVWGYCSVPGAEVDDSSSPTSLSAAELDVYANMLGFSFRRLLRTCQSLSDVCGPLGLDAFPTPRIPGSVGRGHPTGPYPLVPNSLLPVGDPLKYCTSSCIDPGFRSSIGPLDGTTSDLQVVSSALGSQYSSSLSSAAVFARWATADAHGQLFFATWHAGSRAHSTDGNNKQINRHAQAPATAHSIQCRRSQLRLDCNNVLGVAGSGSVSE